MALTTGLQMAKQNRFHTAAELAFLTPDPAAPIIVRTDVGSDGNGFAEQQSWQQFMADGDNLVDTTAIVSREATINRTFMPRYRLMEYLWRSVAGLPTTDVLIDGNTRRELTWSDPDEGSPVVETVTGYYGTPTAAKRMHGGKIRAWNIDVSRGENGGQVTGNIEWHFNAVDDGTVFIPQASAHNGLIRFAGSKSTSNGVFAVGVKSLLPANEVQNFAINSGYQGGNITVANGATTRNFAPGETLTSIAQKWGELFGLAPGAVVASGLSSSGERGIVFNANGTARIINLSNNTVVATVNATNGGNFLGGAVLPNGTKAFLGASEATNPRIDIVDFSTNTIAAGRSVGGVSFLALNADGSKLYVLGNGVGASVLYVFNTAGISNASVPVATINLPNTAQSGGDVDFSPDGTRLYLGNVYSGKVHIINTATNAVLSTIDVNGGQNSIQGVAVNADGTKLFVADFTAGAITVYNTANNALLTSINAANVRYLTTNSTRTVVYGSSNAATNIYVVNAATNALSATWVAGANTGDCYVGNNNNRLYVSRPTSNSLEYFDTSTGNSLGVIATAAGDAGMAGNNTNGVVVFNVSLLFSGVGAAGNNYPQPSTSTTGVDISTTTQGGVSNVFVSENITLAKTDTAAQVKAKFEAHSLIDTVIVNGTPASDTFTVEITAPANRQISVNKVSGNGWSHSLRQPGSGGDTRTYLEGPRLLSTHWRSYLAIDLADLASINMQDVPEVGGALGDAHLMLEATTDAFSMADLWAPHYTGTGLLAARDLVAGARTTAANLVVPANENPGSDCRFLLDLERGCTSPGFWRRRYFGCEGFEYIEDVYLRRSEQPAYDVVNNVWMRGFPLVRSRNPETGSSLRITLRLPVI